MKFDEYPSQATREKIADFRLQVYHGRPTCYFDLLSDLLERAKGMAGIIAASSLAGQNLALNDLGETALVLQYEIETAFHLLICWNEDQKTANRLKNQQTESQAPEAPQEA
jgi:hypothetical protein